MPTSYRLVKGYRVPSDIADLIKSATAKWKQSDDYRWQVARDAHEIVGHYIPDATAALARSLGYDNVSSVEGMAKAWALRLALRHVDHLTPLDNLFISHYVTVAKAWNARVNDAGEDEEKQSDALLWADEILHNASDYDWTIEKLRNMMKGEGGADSWINSVNRIIPNIEAHIIHAPYLGVNEFRAAIAAKVGTLFIRVLRWAMRDDGGQVAGEEVDKVLSLSNRLFPEVDTLT